jgi:hypothetical protein
MKSIRNLVGAALAIVAVTALAQSPYEINGLHTELVFTAAIAQAEKLGGNCQITPSATQDGGTSALCEYAPCSARNLDGGCEPQNTQTTGLTIASQPILRISLEAPAHSAPLSRIVFLFDGRHDAVEATLNQTYGPPSGDVTADQKSWSHARRIRWTQGRYHLGLSNIPKLITLEADQVQK